jgi:hypothetical protein
MMLWYGNPFCFCVLSQSDIFWKIQFQNKAKNDVVEYCRKKLPFPALSVYNHFHYCEKSTSFLKWNSKFLTSFLMDCIMRCCFCMVWRYSFWKLNFKSTQIYPDSGRANADWQKNVKRCLKVEAGFSSILHIISYFWPESVKIQTRWRLNYCMYWTWKRPNQSTTPRYATPRSLHTISYILFQRFSSRTFQSRK